MHMSLDEIGLTLAEARKAVGRSQGVVAASLGMSRATLSGIENGTIREIGVRKLMALCAALGFELAIVPKRKRPTLRELRNEQRAAKNRS